MKSVNVKHTIQVSAAPVKGPVITPTPTSITGTKGKALSGSIMITDASSSYLNISITGVPLGMMFSMNAPGVISYTWASPVAGQYNLTVKVTDGIGLTSQKIIPITIN